MTFRPELLDELLKSYENPEDLLGQGGILKQLTAALVERGKECRDENSLKRVVFYIDWLRIMDKKLGSCFSLPVLLLNRQAKLVAVDE